MPPVNIPITPGAGAQFYAAKSYVHGIVRCSGGDVFALKGSVSFPRYVHTPLFVRGVNIISKLTPDLGTTPGILMSPRRAHLFRVIE